MFVAPYHDWVAAIEFRDGPRFYFDGPKDLFVCFFDLPTYRKGASLTDIADIYVTEYYSTELVDAREVFFVTDSDVLGPMGWNWCQYVAGRRRRLSAATMEASGFSPLPAASWSRPHHAREALPRFSRPDRSGGCNPGWTATARTIRGPCP